MVKERKKLVIHKLVVLTINVNEQLSPLEFVLRPMLFNLSIDVLDLRQSTEVVKCVGDSKLFRMVKTQTDSKLEWE